MNTNSAIEKDYSFQKVIVITLDRYLEGGIVTWQERMGKQPDSDYMSNVVLKFCVSVFLISVVTFIIFVVVGGLNLDLRPPGPSPPLP